MILPHSESERRHAWRTQQVVTEDIAQLVRQEQMEEGVHDLRTVHHLLRHGLERLNYNHSATLSKSL